MERELFKPDEIPERHNLSYFPTVNDLKNHIHEAQKAVGNGELVYEQETIPRAVRDTNTIGGSMGRISTDFYSQIRWMLAFVQQNHLQ